MLERIVYLSAAREVQTKQSLRAILDVARSRNAAAGVTGLLLSGGHWFLQLLEGERSKLEPIWHSIRSDRRHDPVVLVQRRPLRERSFGDWALAFRETGDDEFDRLVEDLTGGINDPRLRDQLLRFSRLYLGPGSRRWGEAVA